jgi:hypothetical protein
VTSKSVCWFRAAAIVFALVTSRRQDGGRDGHQSGAAAQIRCTIAGRGSKTASSS